MMILDHYLYTQNASALQRYFPIVGLTLDFFDHHHKNRTEEGELVVWPTQALETCEMAATLSRLFRLSVLLTWKVTLADWCAYSTTADNCKRQRRSPLPRRDG